MSASRLAVHAMLRVVAISSSCTPFKDDPRCNPDLPFGPPTPVPGLELTGGATSIAGLRLSSDYLTGYFQAENRSDSFGLNDLYTATREDAGAPFTNIHPIVGTDVNTALDETDPTVSGDGLLLVFARGDVGGPPVHIYGSGRPDPSMAFGMTDLLANVNSDTIVDSSPFLREDGQVLYFASARTPPSTDIYRATRNGPDFAAPESVVELNTSFAETAPVVSPDGLVVFYASDRSDGNALGNYDVWMATRGPLDEAFSPPIDVASVNSPAMDMPTFVTRDLCNLYLASTRSGQLLMYVATKPSR
jgi:hypothetical protein